MIQPWEITFIDKMSKGTIFLFTLLFDIMIFSIFMSIIWVCTRPKIALLGLCLVIVLGIILNTYFIRISHHTKEIKISLINSRIGGNKSNFERNKNIIHFPLIP